MFQTARDYPSARLGQATENQLALLLVVPIKRKWQHLQSIPD